LKFESDIFVFHSKSPETLCNFWISYEWPCQNSAQWSFRA